ncbi:MAG: hypothetical protein KatS3mg034_0504 [Vicingaceae bacterium]|nr:MAG: hypothetical protein KatS3mg034_0504 [Vicingaceae bacterium]
MLKIVAMTRISITSFIFVLTAIITSCKKEEGVGGNNTIRGRVYALDYNAELTQLKAQYYAPDEDVFIIYGEEDDIYDDDFKTDYNGRYEFKYLRPGVYTIYAYSKDTTFQEPSGLKVVKQEVTIQGKNQVIEVPDLVIVK